MSDVATYSKTEEAADFLKKQGFKESSVGIILGTGLGSLAQHIKEANSVEYSDCPYFPRATSVGHSGRVVQGILNQKEVIAMEGRFHYYEGYSLQQITFPVRVMKLLGVETLLITNAAGGLNPLFKKGDLMIIDDHIHLMGDSPLVGINDDSMGPRFPDMSEPYCNKLVELTEHKARELKIPVQKGVYVGVKGPQLETRAEYRFLKLIGADAVGMSTIPEVIVANHCGMKVLAISCITDMCLPDALEPVNVPEIIQIANKTEPTLSELLRSIINQL